MLQSAVLKLAIQAAEGMGVHGTRCLLTSSHSFPPHSLPVLAAPWLRLSHLNITATELERVDQKSSRFSYWQTNKDYVIAPRRTKITLLNTKITLGPVEVFAVAEKERSGSIYL